MTAHENTITVRRLLNAKQEQVFAAFSSAEALAEWFTPDESISVDVVAFEFIPEGEFLLKYTMPDGTELGVGGTYCTINKPNKIVFTWTWEAPDVHANIPTLVLIQFIEKSDQTEIVITHDQLPTQEACERHRLGWEGTLDHLCTALSTDTLQRIDQGTQHA